MSPRPGRPQRPRSGSARPRTARGVSLVGARYDVEVRAIAHGGHCVARLGDDAPPAVDESGKPTTVAGTVVFVRHTLPGERVTVLITEGSAGDKFLRGDAVEVLEPSPDRVQAPCVVAGPGGCGGCDFQHVSLQEQRRLKGVVVAEQLRRLAKIDQEVVVEAVPDRESDDAGLRWRTRMRFHRTRSGDLGLRVHRSNAVLAVEECLIQARDARVSVEGETRGPQTVVETVGEHRFEVSADGFWQVHRGAPSTLTAAVLEAASLGDGDRVLDLYSGVGLFAVPCAEAVGVTGKVLSVEGDRLASSHAEVNLRDFPWAHCVAGGVLEALDVEIEGDPVQGPGKYDVVVLDPPREGAKRPVVERIAALTPRAVIYVACDPAALARDLAYFAEQGYELAGLRAFDLFPMTHHVECVAVLKPSEIP